MIKIANRIQIPFSFNYPSGGNLVPAANVSIGVYVRNNDGSQGSPTSVFQSQSGTAQYSSLQTDTGGNVPGWVNEGTYKVVAAASGGFGGGTINFDALYGGGTAAIGVGAVGPSQIAAGAVDVIQLAAAVAQALVPSGTILDYAGTSPPSGFLSCNGSIVSQSSYPALFTAIGALWNTGGEGTGNFRLPNATNRFQIGSGGTLILGHSGGALGHTHGIPGLAVPGLSIPGLAIPSLSVPAQGVSVSGNMGVTGVAHINPESLFGAFGVAYTPTVWGGTTTAWALAGGSSWSYSGSATNPGFGVYTDGTASGTLGGGTSGGGTGGGTTGAGTTGGGTTGANTTGASDPPYIVVNKIIKY